MMYRLKFKVGVEKTLQKLAKKNRKEMDIIEKKIAQILKNPYHFKPLRKPMANKRRVHVVGSMIPNFDTMLPFNPKLGVP